MKTTPSRLVICPRVFVCLFVWLSRSTTPRSDLLAPKQRSNRASKHASSSSSEREKQPTTNTRKSESAKERARERATKRELRADLTIRTPFFLEHAFCGSDWRLLSRHSSSRLRSITPIDHTTRNLSTHAMPGHRKRSGPKRPSFSTYIFKVLKQVHPLDPGHAGAGRLCAPSLSSYLRRGTRVLSLFGRTPLAHALALNLLVGATDSDHR